MTLTRRRLLQRGVLGGSLLAALAFLQDDMRSTRIPECLDLAEREIYGPTDLNAVTGNGGLSVGLTDDATISVLKWPSPSYYDQVKYHTTGRDEDDAIEVASNAGSYLGVAPGGSEETTWLRDTTVVEQGYANDIDDTDAPFSDTVLTRYAGPDGLEVTIRDVVASETDVLRRQVTVTAPNHDSVELVAFENWNLVVAKHPLMPVADWCHEDQNTDAARYDTARDAIVHEKAGVDHSTDDEQSVAIAMGWEQASTGHQVGSDELLSTGSALPQDARVDAQRLPLSGNASFEGQTTGALSRTLEVPDGSATATLLITAAPQASTATDTLQSARDRPFSTVQQSKEAWLGDLLEDAPMPATDDPTIIAVARRALVTLMLYTDRETRATSSSIATQPPYGVDWIRTGGYFNIVFDLIGRADWAETHCRFYADIQSREDNPRPSQRLTANGNWAMDYYSDGVAAGPIPREIDETGYGIWVLWDQYDQTGDEAYLADVYPAIAAAAEELIECRDPATGLPCRTWEDDRFIPDASIAGAAPAWFGLKHAAMAARDPASPGTAAEARRYEDRQHEIGRGIDRYMYGDVSEDGSGTDAYGVDGWVLSELVWPYCFTPYADPSTGEIQAEPQVSNPFEHPRIQNHLEFMSTQLRETTRIPDELPTRTGQYQAKTTLILAMARGTAVEDALPAAKDGIDWMVSEHASADTHVMGEGWKVFDGADGTPEVRSIMGQPHNWTQTLTYLSSLVAYPPAHSSEPGRCGSVIDDLRALQ
ncbi:MAG: hypothetical protein U5K37_08210 [Natrialbaceae archaeon]|nr:hypothetical protein [Natrialbaceae archaeon]